MAVGPSKLFMRSMVACWPQIEAVSFPRSFTHAQKRVAVGRLQKKVVRVMHCKVLFIT